MKQADGIAMMLTLSLRSILSSFVVVSISLLPMLGRSTSAAAVGAVAASAVSVFVLQYSNVISVIWAIQDKTTTLDINSENQLKEVEIPDTVTVVGYRAFWDNEIEELKLSKNLTKIETFAFADNKIKEIEVPEGVTTIGMLSFGGENLQKLIN